MGATYTRQSTYTDGDVIQASDTNDEFNQLLAAFAASTGHTHDGTTAEGGPISKLLDNTLTFGAGTAGTDITVTFDGESNDGVLKWMEDEDYFEFSDDILVASNEKLQFRDTAIYLNSSTDGQLDLVADGAVSIDAGTDIILDVDGADVILKDGGTTYGSLTNSSGELVIKSGSTPTTAMTFSGANVTFAGTVTIGSAGISEAELEILDGATVTTDELNVLDGITSTVGELNIVDGDTSATSTTVADADRVVYNDAGTMKQVAVTDLDTYFSATSKTLTNKTLTTPVIAEIDSGSTITLDATTDIVLDADGGNVIFKDGGTSILDIANNSSDVELTVSTADKNFAIKGTDGSSAITALDIDMALAGKATFSGDVVVTGDLTVSGDDLTMGTNTSGHIMVADGTNFNPVAVSGDVTIASNGAVTIANGAVETAMVNANVISGLDELNSAGVDITNDDLLIHDNDASALKKVSVTNLISSAGGLTEVVADTSPQLGGNLDTNSHNILIDDAHFIADENGNEQIIFQTTASAVNQIDVTNAATGNSPEISATGGDTNISLKLTPKGSGQVLLDGNVGIESGTIDLKNSGSRSKINFYCESGNAHAQALQAAPHSESASNTLTLPSTGGDVDLVSTASTATLTNKTLTSPKINEDVAVTATATEINILDGVTSTTAELNILDGVTSTAAELNILDGVTSTTAELNILDGVTASAADINLIDGITNGTVIASKAIITDSNKDISGGRNITISGELDAATLDISGDADIDGTLEADAITVNGTALNTVIADEATALAIALG
jgi:cytoskeletal protein CcmA (bactofilin family)